jgi:rhomboid protease GluP
MENEMVGAASPDKKLLKAAKRGETEKVKALIDAGADVNAKDEDGYSALMMAASEGHTEIVEILKQEMTEEEAAEAAFQEVLAQSTPRLFVTPIVFWLNILLFAVMVISGVSFLSPTIEQLLAWGANFGPMTFSGEWWRSFSATFIHIGVLHLAVNMWCLWSLGTLAERMFGNWTFLGLYVLSGLGGSVASLWWHPMAVSAGASGAVFGVAGGLIAFFYLGNLTVPPAVLKQNRNNILVFAAYNLFNGFMGSGIDNAAHLGGLAIGLLIGALLHRSLPAPKSPPRRRYYVVFSALTLCLIVGFVAAAMPIALMLMAMNGDTEMVKTLIDAGHDVNAKEKESGTTALMWAALAGHTETVKVLIDTGADVNAESEGGDTALTFAASEGHTEIVEILKQAGAEE